MPVPRPVPRAIGTAFAIFVLSVFIRPGLLLAQNADATRGAVNQALRLDMARFEPFEIAYETKATDGRQLVVTTSYRLDTESGAEPLIRRRQEEEYIDWSDGFPRKTRHYVLESVARASDLTPVRTDAVNHYWDDESSAWISQRVSATFSPGLVSSRWEFPGDTSIKELALPDGTLQDGMVVLALGMSAAPPQDLDLTYYGWLDNEIVETRYDTVRQDSVTTAGRTYEAIVIEGTDPATAAVLQRNYYRAAIPRFFLSTDDPDEPIVVTRVKEGM